MHATERVLERLLSHAMLREQHTASCNTQCVTILNRSVRIFEEHAQACCISRLSVRDLGSQRYQRIKVVRAVALPCSHAVVAK
jgi:hypothetical protein